MPDARVIAFTAISAILFFGTIYSVVNNTYLDTSNHLLTHLPHPLQHTHYFANKANFLNVIFIKKAWGWTSAAFFLLYFTSPSNVQTKERIFQWLTETGIWLVFTSWFFGPAVLERVIALSGGECILALPTGEVISVPQEYCHTRSPLSPSTHPDLFLTPLSLPDASWRATPRMRRGHDISGHVFLLTMSTLFLADQLRSSFRSGSRTWPSVHKWAVGANIMLVAIWFLSIYTTSIYFHTVFEKFTGYLLGVLSFAITQISFFGPSPMPIMKPHQN